MRILNFVIPTIGFVAWIIYLFHPNPLIRPLIGLGFGWAYGIALGHVITGV